MAIQFPTALDALTNPTASQAMNASGVEHDVQHANANDAIEALEAKVGITNSADTSSLDYLVRSLLNAIFNTDANYRIRNGQIQFWDDDAYDADSTKPWRAFGVKGGQTVWSDPIAD
jgi:hypothetical protein